ncbi:MAG: VanZ family protein [Pseudomonadota bacterium]
MRELRFARLWQFGGFTLVTVFLLALLMPETRAPVTVGSYDKLAHLVGFFGLALWFAGVYRREYYVWVVLALLAFGALTEYLQFAFTRSRSGDLVDFAADAIGIALAMVVALLGADRWCAFIEKLWQK